MPRLRVDFSDGRSETIDLARPLVLGRSLECDLPICDRELSRRHCRLEPDAGGWKLTDMGSRNGTFVNGKRVTHSRLGPGDTARAGTVMVRMELAPVSGLVDPDEQACTFLALSAADLDDSFVPPVEFIADRIEVDCEPSDRLAAPDDQTLITASNPTARSQSSVGKPVAGDALHEHHGLSESGPPEAGLPLSQTNSLASARDRSASHRQPVLGPVALALCAFVLLGAVTAGWLAVHHPSPRIMGPNGLPVRVIDD